MIALGALSALVAVAAAIHSIRGDSVVQRRLALLAPALAVTPRWRVGQVAVAKGVGLVVGATIGTLVGGAFGATLPATAAFAYGGWVAPALAVERRAKGRRAEAEEAVGPFLERLDALASAGRPVESAIVALARVPTASRSLDDALRRAADSYVLGAPLFHALSAAAAVEGIDSLGALAASLERARDLGRGSIAVIRDARDAARASERASSLERSSHVEGKLMLTLVLCYLPALMLLVVIPLFLTLLDGLFG